jgi:hypothetical protein
LVFGLPKLNAECCILAQFDGKPYTIPGFPPIVPFDLPRLLLRDQKQPKILFYHGECLWRGTEILVNNVFELESKSSKVYKISIPTTTKETK